MTPGPQPLIAHLGHLVCNISCFFFLPPTSANPIIYKLARGDPPIELVAGPILRFTGLSEDLSLWRGSALIAINDNANSQSQRLPMLFYRITEVGNGNQLTTGSIESHLLIHEYGKVLFRFPLEFYLHSSSEILVEYNINNFAGQGQFYIPSQTQTMNTMFHSCNGFSLGVDPNDFKGDLWNDVLRHHETQHYHVMLGGGDQIYSDMLKEKCPPIHQWALEKSAKKKKDLQYTDQDRRHVEEFFINHYIQWFGQGWWEGPHGKTHQTGFPKALAQIPSINIWDDHDIIDGFGSYNDDTMRGAIFIGIGQAAHKYYLLFQHHTHPKEDPKLESSWISNPRPGPFIKESSRSVYARLGRGVAFVGLDCRTERTLDQIVYPDTYDLVFERLRKELAADHRIRHLLLMVGIPMAYPRLVWLEGLLQSSVVGPLKMLAKHKVALGSFVNNFDGSVEILDDLNDHWCAKVHKQERNKLVTDLQKLAEETSVRISILAGDVHLAAMGRFLSSPQAGNIGAFPESDHRLMLNIISSAITNTPPGNSMADFLNTRNKIHHLDNNTDEDMIKLFKSDSDGSSRNNQTLLPRRNWCSIIEIGSRTARYTPNGNLPSNNNVAKGQNAPTDAGSVSSQTSYANKPSTQYYQEGQYSEQSNTSSDAVFKTSGHALNSCTDASLNEGPIPPDSTNNDKEYTKYPDKPGSLSIVLHVEKSPNNPSSETRPYEIVAPLLIKDKSYVAHTQNVTSNVPPPNHEDFPSNYSNQPQTVGVISEPQGQVQQFGQGFNTGFQNQNQNQNQTQSDFGNAAGAAAVVGVAGAAAGYASHEHNQSQQYRPGSSEFHSQTTTQDQGLPQYQDYNNGTGAPTGFIPDQKNQASQSQQYGQAPQSSQQSQQYGQNSQQQTDSQQGQSNQYGVQSTQQYDKPTTQAQSQYGPPQSAQSPVPSYGQSQPVQPSPQYGQSIQATQQYSQPQSSQSPVPSYGQPQPNQPHSYQYDQPSQSPAPYGKHPPSQPTQSPPSYDNSIAQSSQSSYSNTAQAQPPASQYNQSSFSQPQSQVPSSAGYVQPNPSASLSGTLSNLSISGQGSSSSAPLPQQNKYFAQISSGVSSNTPPAGHTPTPPPAGTYGVSPGNSSTPLNQQGYPQSQTPSQNSLGIPPAGHDLNNPQQGQQYGSGGGQYY